MKYRRFVLGIVAANEKQVGRVEGVVRRCERGGATETVPAEFTTGGYAAARDCDGLICVGAGMCRAWFTSASPSDAGTAATYWERHGWWWQQGLWPIELCWTVTSLPVPPHTGEDQQAAPANPCRPGPPVLHVPHPCVWFGGEETKVRQAVEWFLGAVKENGAGLAELAREMPVCVPGIEPTHVHGRDRDWVLPDVEDPAQLQ